MASAPGTWAPAIARLVAADEDTVRDVIHAFNAIRRWALRENVELCFTPHQRVVGQPDRSAVRALRTFVMGSPDNRTTPRWPAGGRTILRWRNPHARRFGVLAAQRRERARIRRRNASSAGAAEAKSRLSEPVNR